MCPWINRNARSNNNQLITNYQLLTKNTYNTLHIILTIIKILKNTKIGVQRWYLIKDWKLAHNFANIFEEKIAKIHQESTI